MTSLNKRKIINDPVLGFINIPSDFLHDLLQHPFVQRLNRIKQLGLTSFVYPGAQHTRFLHSVGAMHLMKEAIEQLRSKGNEITDEEAEAAMAAILLHDIGHTPFSHSLENVLIKDFKHEKLSLLLIEKMNAELGGKLNTAIEIFTNRYRKTFLHQLVSGQLDMDRLDYLIRDSFFSGVREGSIGADRIIKMLNVKNDELVVEAKGIYSVENFLIARRLMYWQVYLHKTAVATEKMLCHILNRAKELCAKGKTLFASPALLYFLQNANKENLFASDPAAINYFLLLDDSDIICALKVWTTHEDKVLSLLSCSFINRNLFKVKISDTPFEEKIIAELKNSYVQELGVSPDEAHYFYNEDLIRSEAYNPQAEHIKILYNNGEVKDIAEASDILNRQMLSGRDRKFYLCYKLPVAEQSFDG